MIRKGEKMSEKNGLYDLYCCNKYLCSAPANTSVMCPECNRWQNVAGKGSEKLKGDQECLKQSQISL